MAVKRRKTWLDRAIRYAISGGTAYLLELLALFVLVGVFYFDSIAAVAVSFWIGLIASFTLQKILAFQNHVRSTQRLLQQALLYGALILFNYAFTLLFVAILAPVASVFVARTGAIAFTTIWNFIAYRKIIFRSMPQSQGVRAPKS